MRWNKKKTEKKKKKDRGQCLSIFALSVAYLPFPERRLHVSWDSDFWHGRKKDSRIKKRAETKINGIASSPHGQRLFQFYPYDQQTAASLSSDWPTVAWYSRQQ